MAERELYFDKDIAHELADPLRARGIAVHLPGEVGTLGAIDAVHLGTAASHGWILVTRNRRDFRRLHWLWASLNTWGVLPEVHHGILTIYEGEQKPAPPEWAAAIIQVLEEQASLLGTMHMWRPSMGSWQFQQANFM